MNNDREIDKLFKSFNPDVNTERVMTEISDKMDVIDMVCPEQYHIKRFHRMVSVCCFIVGLLAGCFFMSLMLPNPSAGNEVLDFMLPGNSFPWGNVFWTGHREMILTILAATSIILGSLPLINTNEWTNGQF